ncbi:hypothetical protein [Pseudomonas sp. LAM2023]|uniref:hypothetical protein n=1 Tax=Pseudomonas sp. LAM2023 TaxID=2800477 RepID=UPI00190E210D|nr:hypothetical protein [Pseudomonas sp. LAM2023]
MKYLANRFTPNNLATTAILIAVAGCTTTSSLTYEDSKRLQQQQFNKELKRLQSQSPEFNWGFIEAGR